MTNLVHFCLRKMKYRLDFFSAFNEQLDKQGKIRKQNSLNLTLQAMNSGIFSTFSKNQLRASDHLCATCNFLQIFITNPFDGLQRIPLKCR